MRAARRARERHARTGDRACAQAARHDGVGSRAGQLEWQGPASRAVGHDSVNGRARRSGW